MFKPHKKEVESEAESHPSLNTKVTTWLSDVEISRRQRWTEEDTMTLSIPSIAIGQVPTKQKIMEIFNADSEAKKILEREGEARVYEKIKTLFKNRSKRQKLKIIPQKKQKKILKNSCEVKPRAILCSKRRSGQWLDASHKQKYQKN